MSMRESSVEDEVMGVMRGDVGGAGGKRGRGVVGFVEDSMAGRVVDGDEFLAAVRRRERGEGCGGDGGGMGRVREGLGRLSVVSCAAGVLLMVALCPMPGWYYAGMRVGVFLFGVLAGVVFFRRGAEWRAVLAGAVAVLFNPWVRMGLHGGEWLVADLVCGLVVLVFLQLPRGM